MFTSCRGHPGRGGRHPGRGGRHPKSQETRTKRVVQSGTKEEPEEPRDPHLEPAEQGLFKQAFRQLCPCFLSCRRNRPSVPVCDVLPARPQDHTPESSGYTHFTYCLHLISRECLSKQPGAVLSFILNTLLTDP